MYNVAEGIKLFATYLIGLTKFDSSWNDFLLAISKEIISFICVQNLEGGRGV